MTAQTLLALMPLQSHMIPAAVCLDQKTLGGLWTTQGYQNEIDRDKGICLGLFDPSGDLLGMGFSWVIFDEAHITLIAIDPLWQSQGLGSIILNRLLQLAVDQNNCARATLEVDGSNQAAIHLYQKFQFQALGQRPNYYGPDKDALILWRNQLQSPDYQAYLANSLAKSQFRLKQAGLKLVDYNLETSIPMWGSVSTEAS
jgi:[ribosomal protein S18]-alanine N-acetyltransferase